jgi:glycosyltransferase involved in cell wall biosynthesis
VDGQDCLRVDDCTAESFAEAVKRALALSPEELSAMKRAARECAVRHFDYRNYIEAIDRIFQSAVRSLKGNVAQ